MYVSMFSLAHATLPDPITVSLLVLSNKIYRTYQHSFGSWKCRASFPYTIIQSCCGSCYSHSFKCQSQIHTCKTADLAEPIIHHQLRYAATHSQRCAQRRVWFENTPHISPSPHSTTKQGFDLLHGTDRDIASRPEQGPIKKFSVQRG